MDRFFNPLDYSWRITGHGEKLAVVRVHHTRRRVRKHFFHAKAYDGGSREIYR
jgi:hypothetical protein